jgi:hypothetical protein
MNLNNGIQGYLAQNNISFNANDYSTGEPDGQADQILYWNAAALGAEPTQAQLEQGEIFYSEQTIKNTNTENAKALLSATDWTAIASVANPQDSQPYLTNQAAFLSYRSAVRDIAVNPPAVPATFPTVPKPTWSN